MMARLQTHDLADQEDVVNKMSMDIPDPRPGQMYLRRDGTVSAWIVEHVSEARRTTYRMERLLCRVPKDQPFTIVTVDDPGPFDFPTQPHKKRWHLALLKDRLIWLNHELLQFSVLVSDAK